MGWRGDCQNGGLGAGAPQNRRSTDFGQEDKIIENIKAVVIVTLIFAGVYFGGVMLGGWK